MPFPDSEHPIVKAPAKVVSPEPEHHENQSKTTSERNHNANGQRRIHLIREVTLSCLALFVTGTVLYVAAQRSLFSPGETTAFLLLSNGFFLVIGFYFGFIHGRAS